MKKRFIWLAVSLLFIVVGCVEGLNEPDATETSSEQLPNLTAGFAEEVAKTYVEGGKYLRWHEDDRLTAFYGNTRNRQYKFDGATGDNNGSFSHVSSGDLETGNPLDRIYAVYPYDETATITDDGQISLNLPAVQTYAENSFGRGANTMLAATENVEDTFLPFKNVCGYLKLKLYNSDGATIKSIEVKGNGEDKIAGAATATIDFGVAPQLTMADDATKTITLDCGDGIALGTSKEAATEFWVVIPETTFESGITITVTDTEGGIFEKSTTKEVVIERNAVQPMAALEVICLSVDPASNEIWYTNGSTTKATAPYKTDVFGANIVSNTYDAVRGCWVIKFDGKVTTIGGSAFQTCSNLTSVTIPDSVTTIGDYAFYNCSGIKSITIPDSVTSIGSSAFKGCKLTSVYITELSAWCKIDFKTDYSNPLSNYIKTNLYLNNELVTELVIPSDITEIKSYAFYYCSSLTSVTIPDSVTSIGSSAFWGCESLTSATIPDSVTTIGEKAFLGCSKLTSVYCMAKTPPSLGNNGFIQNVSTYIYVPYISVVEYRTATNWSKYADNIVAYDFEKGEVVVSKPANSEIWYKNGSTTEATSPYKTNVFGANIISNIYDVANGYWVIKFDGEVTTIGDNAFWKRENITSVIIPDSVTTIGENAFQYCSLTSITIPDSVTKIGNYAFGYCDLTSVTIPGSVTEMGSAFSYCSKLTSVTFGNGITTIGGGAFSSCESLTSVTIPDSVTKIGSGAFRGCKKLKSIAIPDNVTTIGGEAFRYCSSLTSITIPDGITTIDELVFDECTGLTSVNIPDSVTSIGRYAFRYCSSLTNITIPDGVTEIGNNAFYECSSLTSVYCKATIPPSLGYYVFDYHASDRKIYVPAVSVEEYRTAENWSEHADAIVAYDF